MKEKVCYPCGRIRFGIIGSGWRAEFYIRIAAAVPELFELTGVLVRSREKKEYLESTYHIKATLDSDWFYKADHDFVVVSISKPDIGSLLLTLMDQGIPVLSETPPAVEEQMLTSLWDKKVTCRARILVAEQYYLYPMIQAKLKAIEMGFLEPPYHIMTSYAHDYHGMSLIRKFLGTGFQNAVLHGDSFDYPVAETVDRDGLCQEGKTIMRPWFRSTIVFEDGKTAFYDFSPVLYQSFLRSRNLTIMSRNGQIENEEIKYQNKQGQLVKEYFHLLRDPFDEDCIRVLLGGNVLYENLFPKTRLTEDEIAIAQSMIHMKQYLETGKAMYTFAEALQDTYMAMKMKEAAAGGGKKIDTVTQAWADADVSQLHTNPSYR